MNSVILIGRLTKNPELAYVSNNQKAKCTFTLAVDRPNKEADFIRIIVWDKQGENCNQYLAKGARCCVQGRIQTGSYKDKEGRTIYTTDVVASWVEFLEKGEVLDTGVARAEEPGSLFQELQEDLPF